MNLKEIYNYIKQNYFAMFTLLYQTLFAIFLLIGLFYMRLVPRVSRELWEQMNHYQLLSLVIKMILVVINIYVILVLLEVIKQKKKYTLIEFFKGYFIKFSTYLISLLIDFYNLFWYLVEELAFKFFGFELLHYSVMRKVAQFMITRKHPKLVFYFLITLSLLPRIVFILAFTYDVLVQQYLYYTFLFLPFLLISLIEKFIVFSLWNFHELYWEGTSALVQKTNVGSFIKYEFIPEYRYTPPPSPPKVSDFDDYYDNHYFVLAELDRALNGYKSWKVSYFPYYKTLLWLSIIRFLLLIFMLVYGTL